MRAVQISKLRVSTVLNDETKSYGKQYLLDDRDDTCWNSGSGEEQFVLVQLSEPSNIRQIQLMFQGGFVAKQCDICIRDDSTRDWKAVASVYPADSNALQSFDITGTMGQDWMVCFRQPTDFYGRITLYRLSLLAE